MRTTELRSLVYKRKTFPNSRLHSLSANRMIEIRNEDLGLEKIVEMDLCVSYLETLA